MRRADVIGLAALVALACLAPSRPAHAAPVPVLARRPREPRAKLRHDALVPLRPEPVIYVLVQTCPTVQVLAVSPDHDHLWALGTEMTRVWDESHDPRVLAVFVHETRVVFGA